MVEVRSERWNALPHTRSSLGAPNMHGPQTAVFAHGPSTLVEAQRRILATVPTPTRSALTAPAECHSRSSLMPVRAFAPPPRRAASTSRARPLAEPPAPQPAATPRLSALDLAGGAAPRRAPQLVAAPRRRVHFGAVEVFEVESFKMAMKEMQDPKTKGCIACDKCGEWAPRVQRSPDQRVIRRQSKLDWICTACLQETGDSPNLGVTAEKRGSRPILQQVRSAAEYIMSGGGSRPLAEPPSSEQPFVLENDIGDSLSERSADPAGVSEGVRANAVPAGKAAPAIGLKSRLEQRPSLERLLTAAGMAVAAASTVLEKPPSTPPAPGVEVAMSARRRRASSAGPSRERRDPKTRPATHAGNGEEEISDAALVQQLVHTIHKEVKVTQICLAKHPQTLSPGKPDPWMEAMESMESALATIAEVMRGHQLVNMATL